MVKKNFAEDTNINNIKQLLFKELRGNKELIEEGIGDSSSGSDDAPSEDNMEAEEICKLIPAVEKKIKNALKKYNQKKKNDKKNEKKKKNERRDSMKDKKPKIVEKKPTSEKDKKKKPVMVDACTQTDRSDFAIIKQRMLAKLES